MIDSLRKAARRYAIHMTAIVVMIVVALGIAGYLLSNQRFYLPAWVPVIGTDFYTVSAEFETAQAVTPGQGQTVNIAGVPVGEIGSVKLLNGRAIVEMKIRRKHAPVYRDARLSLRPKTALNDMYIDMKPGKPSAGAIAEDGVVPLANTKPAINFDEFLSVLDADTRNYFQLLLDNAGKGLKGQGGNLRSGFKRFPTTGKYGVRIVKLLEKRDQNIERSIHSLSLLAKELGDNSDQLASLIDSSSATFQTWASEQDSIREIIEKTPAALGETADAAKAAQQVVADSAVAFKDLEPLARDTGKALRGLRPFFKDQTAVTRDKFRPFARDVQPLLEQLKPAATNLGKLAPDATSATKSFNTLLNIVAYNPKGSEEGYLYWLSWFSHLSASTFNMQDAHGVLPGGSIYTTCTDLRTTNFARNAVESSPILGTITNLLGLPRC